MNITSDPSGALVYINGGLIGPTPLSVKLQASENHQIRFEKDGYHEKNYLLNYHVGLGWVCLGLMTAIIPIIIDLATQSWYELDDNDIHAKMVRK